MVLCLLSLGFWKKMEFKKERRKWVCCCILVPLDSRASKNDWKNLLFLFLFLFVLFLLSNTHSNWIYCVYCSRRRIGYWSRNWRSIWKLFWSFRFKVVTLSLNNSYSGLCLTACGNPNIHIYFTHSRLILLVRPKNIYIMIYQFCLYIMIHQFDLLKWLKRIARCIETYVMCIYIYIYIYIL